MIKNKLYHFVGKYIFLYRDRRYIKTINWKELASFFKASRVLFHQNEKAAILNFSNNTANFSQLLMNGWSKKNMLIINVFKNEIKECLSENQVVLSNSLLIRMLNIDYIISFDSGVDDRYLRRNTKLINLPHSLVSLHSAYTKNAFKYVDYFLACGPHHTKEFDVIKVENNMHNSKSFKAGYLKVDELFKNKLAQGINEKSVVIAPSWGVQNHFLNTVGEEVVITLLNKGWKVYLRPHPRIIDKEADLLESYLELGQRYTDQLVIDAGKDFTSFYNAQLMISDWSGAAYEFAFGLLKPVLFIEWGEKVVNQSRDNFIKTDLPIMEDVCRSKIGLIAKADNWCEKFELLIDELPQWNSIIEKSREEYLFNIGESKATIHDIIDGIISQ